MTTTLEQLQKAVLYWDDLPVGTRYTTSSRTVTETDIVAFAGLTADYNRAHVDDEFAKTSHFGKRIAHGMLVASMSVGLNTRTIQNQLMESALIALLENKLAFPKPTFCGDTIEVEVEVAEQHTTSKPDKGVIVFKRRTFNQRREIVVDSTVALLMKRRPLDT